MRRADLIPALLLGPLLGFIAAQALAPRTVTTTVQAASLAPGAGAPSAATEHVFHTHPMLSVSSAFAELGPAAARDVDELRHLVALGAPGTYIDDILAERDSALARWPDRNGNPIVVWVGSGRRISGWSDDFPAQVRDAFDEWSALGIPVRFAFATDSASAEVHVTWIDHFDTPISGKTVWARDRNWWIVNGNITLALHHNGGEPLDDAAVKAIALHEVGHLLGLDHTVDTTNIMTARVRVRDLSSADRATMRLLYSLPPGSLK